MNPAVVVPAFRVVAVAEALSWIGLLAGMYVKHVLGTSEAGVQVFGPIHGTVFLTYVVVTLVAWRRLRWPLPVAAVGLAASIPPFCTVLFEEWVRRRSRAFTSPA